MWRHPSKKMFFDLFEKETKAIALYFNVIYSPYINLSVYNINTKKIHSNFLQ